MPIESPQLDDLRFKTVRDLLIRQIPIVAPEWTDHNDSDPGVALIQLFAYLADQLGYRLNQIPDKNYVEFLKLIGVRLQAAEPAETSLELILAKPETTTAFLVPAGTRVQAARPGPDGKPIVFETDADLDAVPAQLAGLVTTYSDDLRVIQASDGTPDATVDIADYLAQRYRLVWNGKAPKLKDMPAQPLAIFPAPLDPLPPDAKRQSHLWIALAFNPSRAAGFLGQQVSLTVQLDDDEQPSPDADVQCGATPDELSDPSNPDFPVVAYQYYRPLNAGKPPTVISASASPGGGSSTWRYRLVAEFADPASAQPRRRVLGRVSDELSVSNGGATLGSDAKVTLRWVDPVGASRVHIYRTMAGGAPASLGWLGAVDAGTERFVDAGSAGDGNPPPTGGWHELVALSDSTDGWTRSGVIRFEVPDDMGAIPDGEWAAVRAPVPKTTKQMCEEANKSPTPILPPPAPVPHPLIGAIKVPVDGAPTLVPVSGWIHVTFGSTVPSFKIRGLSFNVAQATQAQTVRGELVGTGSGLPGQTMALSRQNVLAGTLTLALEDVDQLTRPMVEWTEVEDFATATPDDKVYLLDREAGQIVFGDGVHGRPAPETARVVALQYRWGGGDRGPLDVGTINKPESLPAPVQDATNLVSARGGRDAETLDAAKARAPRELKVLERAVTAEDYELLALQAPGVQVARALTVPLHRPYADLASDGPGLDLEHKAAGVLSLVVVPKLPGPYPTPTATMLRTVCAYLDRFRLLTTELHTVPPQYVRLYQVTAKVKAKPGYTRTLLRDAIAAQLQTYFHVLRGGPDGQGFPFGGALHHADLVAQIFAVPGVDRVDDADALFDGNAPAPAGSPPPMQWRLPRRTPGHLTGCVVDAAVDVVSIQLAADENVFVDATDLEVVVVS